MHSDIKSGRKDYIDRIKGNIENNICIKYIPLQKENKCQINIV